MEFSADFFVSTAVVEREVTLQDGTKVKCFFRKVSVYDWNRFIAHASSQIADERADASSILVSASVSDAAGKSVLPLEKARLLKKEVMDDMFKHALALNKRDDAEEKAGNA